MSDLRPFGLFSSVCLVLFVLGGGTPAEAQQVRIDAGGGWSIPTGEVRLERADGGDGVLLVDLTAGPHYYGGVGFVRSISEHFAVGARVRGHLSHIRGQIDFCENRECTLVDQPEGALRAGTLEGRIILTTSSRIRPYLLVGMGLVESRVGDVTVTDIDAAMQPETVPFSESRVVDAGGDVGLGASLRLFASLYLDGEMRATGSLPGAKDNAFTAFPFSLGLSYGF